ncbi:MAG: glycosyltransferase family 39 protein, partial [Candidatus Melainabacteria bacterium]|nr:glycosyltransferase family 39 protein [Candidatus Melainabacteria bacterium]
MFAGSLLQRTQYLAPRAVLIIVAYYLFTVFFVSPVGNFPLNDDWTYGEAIRHWVSSGRFELGASCATCFLHIALGGLACKIFGFSYAILRTVTLSLGFIGALAFYLTLREVGLSKASAGLFALVLVANPLRVNLSFSYMTDIAASSFTSLYFLFFVRGIKKDAAPNYALASVMLLATLATRQTAVVYIICNFAVLLTYWLRKRHSWTIMLALIVLPILWTWGLGQLMQHYSAYPAGYFWFRNELAAQMREFLHRPLGALFAYLVSAGQVSCYFGLFFAPVLVPCVLSLKDLFKSKVKILPVCFAISAGTISLTLAKVVVAGQKLMPFNQNLLRMPAVG